MGGPNHPFVVWGSCFLWLISMFAVTWSITLFYCIGDMLLITGTDLVMAVVLLSGIIMLPTNVFMLYTIGNGQKITHTSSVLCCPLWVLMVWIIFINCVGIYLCVQRIAAVNCLDFITHSMKHYRSVPRYKRFMDNLQWSLKCCGLDSYKDWFNYDWYEKVRDYEWNPTKKKLNSELKRDMTVHDSVPLSCCKTGTCIPNYLLELGTHSIYTKGCFKSMDRLYTTSVSVQLIVFTAVVITEVLLLTCIMSGSRNNNVSENLPKKKRMFNVRHIMPVNNKFLDSSSSASMCPDDSDVDMRGLQEEKTESQ